MGIKIPFTDKQISITPAGDEASKPSSKQSSVNQQFIDKLQEVLQTYITEKEPFDNKIILNDQWFKSQHWDLMRAKQKDQDPEPVTAFLFNSIANKHADAMDNYPNPNMLEREENDADEASRLTKIVPLVLEKNRFRRTYSRAWWYKLKQGASAFGVFWNPSLENGLGDIDIKKLDILNLYWQGGLEDIQDSPFFFILAMVDNELLTDQYPQLKGKLGGGLSGSLQIKTYAHNRNVNYDRMSLVVDAYYKRYIDGKQIVHLTKFCNGILLDSTENHDDTKTTGLYDHGMYPVFLDVLFPDEGTATGFGFIDIVKNPQAYIDKLDQIITKNALIAGKQRHFVKSNGGVDEKELLNLEQDVIHVNGDISQQVTTFQAASLDPFIVQHRQNKISELKEVSANRDFQQGGTNGGVTAYGAIAALQEAGNKLSRDMIGDSYEVYTQMLYMCVELIRQFYNEDRNFRITGDGGKKKYVAYNNQALQQQTLQPSYDGEGMTQDPQTGQMIPDPNYNPNYRKPVFDIEIKPERSNPFSREAQNQRAQEMYNAGMFNPQNAVAALIALEMMSFEGKEQIVQLVMKNDQTNQIMQQYQQLAHQVPVMQQTMQQMAQVIHKLTGKNLFDPNMGGVPDANPNPVTMPNTNGGVQNVQNQNQGQQG